MGDVSGDGLPEILMADPFGDPGVDPIERMGRVTIINGATGAEMRTIVPPEGSPANGFFGYSVSAIRDVNGDGLDDVGIGETQAANAAGRAYIFDGATGDLLHTLVPPQPASGGHFGTAVTGLGDVNGDGRGDVAVSQNAPGPGYAYIFDGAQGTLLHELKPEGTVREFGWAMSRLPDVDDDGRPDIVVGQFYYPPNPPGMVHVFSGATGQPLIALPGHSDFGGQRTVAGIEDLDGDGKSEVLVADPWADVVDGGRPIVDAGQVTLYLSKPRPIPPSLQIVGRQDDSFLFSVSPVAESTVTVEATSDFVSWVTLTTVPPGTDPVEIEDSDAPNHRQRFYRTVQAQ